MAPSMHPQAKFDPIPPNLDLHNLVDRTPNFEWAMRISAKELMRFDAQRFEKLVYLHVIAGGKPLVITDWNLKLPKSIFSAAFLQNTYDKKEENVRDINAQSDIPMTTGHYLRSMKQLTDQWTPSNFRDERRQRLYLKDIDCPPEWHDYLRKVIPPVLFYMNENVDDKGVPRNEARDEGMFADEQTNAPAAPAGDLMSSLPEDMRAQNLMCYIGHEGTYTPAHREMCASLGQNIMVDASGDEKGEKPGSSIWFMTETKDREVVREYFLSMLGHDIEIEKHFAQVNAWKKATFPVYIVEQKVGDFILVPPLAPHQVWNRGTRTMKVAWNRTTVETLELALHEALPKARLVCRDEQYKNKAIIYFTLRKYYAQLNEMEEAEMSWLNFGQDLIRSSTSSRKDQMAKDFKKLLSLFTEILVDEMFGQKEKDVEMIPFDSFVTCSYCRANIFNRFLTCKHCVRQLVNGDEDTYDVCMECYAMGRSCLCISKLSWCEQWDWSELVNNYAAWCEMVIRNDQVFDVETSPLPLEVARRKAGKKSLAQICQEQLRRRPFRDISKPEEPSDLEPSDPELDDNNRPKKKSRRKKKKGDVYRCHVCSHKDYTHRLAFCSNQGCREAYCFGTLYRGFDLMPQDVLQDEKWQCPKCRKICNCGGCRRLGNTTPYQPKNTFIGHDTRSVADDRSVESLVDFRLHNLNWLKAAGDEPRNHNSKRMERLRQQADAEKAKDGASRDAVGPALADGVAATMDHTMPESMPEGFDDLQNAVRAENVPADYSIGDPSAHQQNENGGPAEVADMMTAISQDPSSYPDPSMYPDPLMMGGERRLGMGYYEHDDTPDKILFDPYQMPSADVIALDDEPSEFVKKTLRAAKRRARLDDDNDPDFLAPKSHKKRPRLEKDMLVDPAMTLDPAFLTQDNTMTEAQANGSTEPEPEPTNVEEDEPEEEDREDSADQYKPYEPNVPALRHSKPKVSYADFEHDVEEFNDVVPVKNTADTGDNDAPSQVTDPLDAAANAIRALTGTDTPQETTPAPTRVAASSSTGRRRGRSAGARGARGGRGGRVSTHTAPETSVTSQPASQKRRGRPPRKSFVTTIATGKPAMASTDDEESPIDIDIDELEAQLAREIAEADEEEAAGGSARAPVAVPLTSEDSAPKKRRGRPPKAKPAETPTSVSRSARATRSSAAPTPPIIPTVNTPFLSMAERMKLKGKSFKIGQRRSGRGVSNSHDSSLRATPTTAGPSHEKQATESPNRLSAAREQQSDSHAEPEEPVEPVKKPFAEPAEEPAQATPSSEETPYQDDLPAQREDSPYASSHHSEAPESVKEVPPSPSPPAPSPPRRTGPTIVRLGSSSDEESEPDYNDAESASDSDSDSDGDDEGIPARNPAYATRGRPVASRGRGRGGRMAHRGRGGRGGRGGRAG